MAASSGQAALGRTFIGRAQPLAILRQLLEDAQGGHGQLALIAGEAGIGKTRLVSELAEFAGEQGWTVLDGYCFPQDRLCPYAPFLNLLRTYYWQRSGDLEAFIHELSPLVPDLLSLPAAESPITLAPELEKRRTFTALARLFMQRAAEQPLLLIIEDIHWCDDVSLEFLFALARQCADYPICLVLTYRDDESKALLLPWLAQLDRAHLGHEILLTHLTRDEVAAMLSAMFALASPV